jgi:molecular chaperone DnaK (HSP70)
VVHGLDAGEGACRLAIDFGTSSTVGMVSWPDGRSTLLLFDGSPLLPSAVCADPSRELLVGGDAVHAATVYPGSFEPHPKRHIDDGVLLLGDVEVEVTDAIAAVLRRVVDEASRVAGTRPATAVLTHPVSWGGGRCKDRPRPAERPPRVMSRHVKRSGCASPADPAPLRQSGRWSRSGRAPRG